jgi:hypothetical protein
MIYAYNVDPKLYHHSRSCTIKRLHDIHIVELYNKYRLDVGDLIGLNGVTCYRDHLDC